MLRPFLVRVLFSTAIVAPWLAASGPASTARTARYISNDPDLQFERVETFDASAISEDVHRTDMKIDVFGQVYVAMDGSHIVLKDSGAVPSQQEPVWASGLGQSSRYRLTLNGDRNELRLIRCATPCRRSTSRTIWSSAEARTLDHPAPALAVDYAGGIHVAFSDGQDVFLTSSADDGETWKEPIQVNDRVTSDTEAATAPALIAGDSGRVAMFWEQGTQLWTAYTTDAFSTDPSFHATVVEDSASMSVVASAAIDPLGSVWVAYRSNNELIVKRQEHGSSLVTGVLWSAYGSLQGENSQKRLSVNVRQDLTGHFAFFDPGFHLLVRGDHFKVSNRTDGEIAISGTGMLQNGSSVVFTLLVPEASSEGKELSISMNNGYFTAGKLVPSKRAAADLHIVGQGVKQFDGTPTGRLLK